MHNKLLILILLVVPMFSFNSDKFDLEVGKKAPKISKKMKDISGDSYALADLKKEKGLVVVFSCNTCPFVVGNDDFEGWEKQYNTLFEFCEKSGFGFVLINSNEAKRGDEDSFDKMKLHATTNNYKMKYLVDQDSELADAFGARTTPHIYLLDENMKLVYTGPIDNGYNKKAKKENYLRDAISYTIKGKKIAKTSVAPVGCSIKRTK